MIHGNIKRLKIIEIISLRYIVIGGENWTVCQKLNYGRFMLLRMKILRKIKRLFVLKWWKMLGINGM